MEELTGALSGTRIVVCAGAGGVGKTTVSAAVGLGLAAAGRRVAVVTIDPARRLAEALGLEELGNEPQPVDGARFQAAGLPVTGELSAMMLDVKRTFDALVARLAPDAQTAGAIFDNPVYQHLSTAVAGSQEYTAIAKLFDLARADIYDVIVLDTPPSRSAAAFLEAPRRLSGFLESRALTAFLGPTGVAARAAGVAFAALRRITGVSLLDDLTAFFQLFARLLDGLRERVQGAQQLLTEPTTGFLIITSPEHAPLREAVRFGRELERLGMRRAGVIVNRVQPLDVSHSGAPATADGLAPRLGVELAEKVARTHAEIQLLAHRDGAAIEELRRDLVGAEPIVLADRETDVHDTAMLVELERELFGDASA